MLFCNSCTQRIFQSFWTGWNWSFILHFTFRHHHHHHHHHRHQRHHHHHLHLLLVIQILVAAIPPWVTKRDLMCRVRVGLSQFKFFFSNSFFFLTTFVFLAVFVGFLLSCLLFFPCSARFCHPASVVLATDKKQQFNPKWFSSSPFTRRRNNLLNRNKGKAYFTKSKCFQPRNGFRAI